MMELLGPTTLIHDHEVASLMQSHYGRDYNPSEHGHIGGDDGDGYVLVRAGAEQLEQYDYWQEWIADWIDSGVGEAPNNLDGIIHRLVIDGHIPAGVYVVHGQWG